MKKRYYIQADKLTSNGNIVLTLTVNKNEYGHHLWSQATNETMYFQNISHAKHFYLNVLSEEKPMYKNVWIVGPRQGLYRADSGKSIFS